MRLTPIGLVDPALDPAAAHQHLHGFRNGRQADALVARQLAHRAGTAADAAQRRPLRHFDRRARSPQLGPEGLRHQVHDIDQLARGVSRVTHE